MIRQELKYPLPKKLSNCCTNCEELKKWFYQRLNTKEKKIIQLGHEKQELYRIIKKLKLQN